jgi:hypothetical protein
VRKRPQWVVWGYNGIYDADGTLRKFDKPPLQAKAPTENASSTAPRTWASLAAANTALSQHPDILDGLGFALGAQGTVLEDGSYLSIGDFDKCRDPATGIIDPAARALIAGCATYAEVSPSGNGVRILARVQTPQAHGVNQPHTWSNGQAGRIEWYTAGKYLTLTGQHLADTPATIEDATAAIAALLSDLDPSALDGDDRETPVEPMAYASTPRASTAPGRDRQMVAAIAAAWPQTAAERDQGSRHDHLLRPLAGFLARRTDVDHACALLAAAAAQSGDPERDWRGEIRRLVQNAAAKVTAEGRVAGLPVLATHYPELAQVLEALWPSPTFEVPAEPAVPPKALPFKTARAIAESTPEHVDWIAEPWLARGAITEFDGKIKSSGKTTLLMKMCRKILDGEPFMDKPTTQGPVVYLTEQTSQGLRAGLARADLLDREDFHLLCWADLGGLRWEQIAPQAVAYAEQLGAVALVVDTLGQFSGVSGDSENDSGRAMDVMAPLQQATARGQLAIGVARHDRKSGGDVGESGRGSSAYGGTVDTIVQVQRASGDAQGTERVRILKSLSRFGELVPSQLVIELGADGEYHALGDESAYAQSAAEAKLRAALPTTQDEACTQTELEQATGANRRYVADALKRWRAEGAVQFVGCGKKGAPYRYWVGDAPAADDADAGDLPTEEQDSNLILLPIEIGLVTESNYEDASAEAAEAALSVTPIRVVTESDAPPRAKDSVTSPITIGNRINLNGSAAADAAADDLPELGPGTACYVCGTWLAARQDVCPTCHPPVGNGGAP